jgi:hypothetical protein
MRWTHEMHLGLYEALQFYARRAMADERDAMGSLLMASCLRVTGPTWSFGDLARAVRDLEQALTPQMVTRGSKPRVKHIEYGTIDGHTRPVAVIETD